MGLTPEQLMQPLDPGAETRVLLSLRIGGDGRYGIPLVECAHCGHGFDPKLWDGTLPPHDRGMIVHLRAVDYPLVHCMPTAPLEAHVLASPSCASIATSGWHGGPPAPWPRGIVAHVLVPA